LRRAVVVSIGGPAERLTWSSDAVPAAVTQLGVVAWSHRSTVLGAPLWRSGYGGAPQRQPQVSSAEDTYVVAYRVVRAGAPSLALTEPQLRPLLAELRAFAGDGELVSYANEAFGDDRIVTALRGMQAATSDLSPDQLDALRRFVNDVLVV